MDAVPATSSSGQIGRRVRDDGGLGPELTDPVLSRLYHPVARGQDAGHRRQRLPRLPPGAGARGARRRAAPAAAPRVQASDHLSDLEFERAAGDVLDRAAVRAGRCEDVDRVFHLAGHDLDAPADRDRVFELNTKGTRIVLEEALRGRASGGSCTPPRSPRSAPAKPGGTADEDQPFRAGAAGHRLRQLQARGRGRGAAARRARAVRGDRQPVVRPRPGRSERDLHGARTPLPAGAHPGLRRAERSTSSTSATWPTGYLLADEKGESGERYILGGRNFTLDRLFADFARISGREPPVRLPAAPTSLAVEAIARVGLPIAVSPDEVRSASSGGPIATRRHAASSGFEPRPHEETLEDAVRWQMARARRPRAAAARAPQEAGGRGRRAALAAGRRVLGPVIVLYRCPTRTNVLCPCGAVARRLDEARARAPDRAGAVPAFGPPGDRGADPPTARAGPGRRRRGDPRLEADPPVPRLEVRALTAIAYTI